MSKPKRHIGFSDVDGVSCRWGLLKAFKIQSTEIACLHLMCRKHTAVLITLSARFRSKSSDTGRPSATWIFLIDWRYLVSRLPRPMDSLGLPKIDMTPSLMGCRADSLGDIRRTSFLIPRLERWAPHPHTWSITANFVVTVSDSAVPHGQFLMARSSRLRACRRQVSAGQTSDPASTSCIAADRSRRVRSQSGHCEKTERLSSSKIIPLDVITTFRYPYLYVCFEIARDVSAPHGIYSIQMCSSVSKVDFLASHHSAWLKLSRA